MRYCPIQMWTSFHMYRDYISPGINELRDIGIRVLDHKVSVERKLCDRSDRFHDEWSDGNIRHKMSVHHVKMQPVSSAIFHLSNALFQASKIGRKQGWRKLHPRPSAIVGPMRIHKISYSWLSCQIVKSSRG